jgi:hypothetical protein
MSQKKLAKKESAKKEIKELIRTMLTYRPSPIRLVGSHDEVFEQTIAAHIAELKQKITAYLKDKTINLAVVKNLHKHYLNMFDRTNDRRDDDMHWLDDPTQEQKDKIRIQTSILHALQTLGDIKTGGKKSRSKKRGLHRRKSIHRRKKSIKR